MQKLFTHIFNVTNVMSHTLGVEKIVLRPWIKQTKVKNLIQKNWFVLHAVQCSSLLNVKNMERTLSRSNAAFVVQ